MRALVRSLALLASVLVVAAAAQARPAAQLQMNVQFALNGSITVTLANGTLVGSTSGSPTVIPAGYYVVALTGPGGCTAMPHFDLRGPGETIHDNLNEGESDYIEYNAYFRPSSTYTWTSDAAPGVTHTFVTTADVEGTAPAHSPNGLAASKHTTVSSSDLIGSGVLPFRGTITGDVSASGRLTFAFKGKSVTALKAGRYAFAVTDKSAKTGFMLEHGKYNPVSLTGARFVGKRTTTVRLVAGHWLVFPRVGLKGYAILVS